MKSAPAGPKPRPQLKPTTPLSPRPVTNGTPDNNHRPLPPKRPPVQGKPLTTNRPVKRLELPPTSSVGAQGPQAIVEMPTQLSPAVIKGLNVPVIFPKPLEPQVLPKTEKNQTRIIPIGGLRTVGANMTMFEHGDDILIVDGGLEFARGGKSPGFNYLLPDIRFLQPHLKRIK